MSYRDIGISVRPNVGMHHTLKHQGTRDNRDVLQHLLAHFLLRVHVPVLAAVQARHPLGLAHVGHLHPQEIREHSHRYVSTVLFPVPFLEYLRRRRCA